MNITLNLVRLEDLKNDLDRISKLNDERIIILFLHLYAEHFVNDFIKINSGEIIEKEIRTGIGFPAKLRILKNLEIIDEDKEKILSIFNNLRDMVIHNLVVDNNKIKLILDNFKKKGAKVFNFVLKENPEIKGLFKSLSPFDKFKISMIWIIYEIWGKLQFIMKKDIEEKIVLKPGDDGKIYVHFYKKNKDEKKTN
ncbi:MAG: hypothetical protein Q7R52_03310 [archaeon]|nr:hypothetical protein [archaeon]